MKTFVRCLLVAVVFLANQAMAQTLHSKVKAEAQSKNGKIFLGFLVTPDSGNVVNDEAPWKIEVLKYDGLTVATPIGKGPDVIKSLPALTITGIPEKPAGEVEWKLTAFVCSKDKTNCFRDVHTGKLAWKK